MYKENETIELKKSLAQLREGIISLGSMLNKSKKGTVYFGIKDDGTVVGLDVGKKTIVDITHEIQNNLKPLPSGVKITEVNEDNKTVLKVSVEGDDSPYSAYGRYYIRINDTDILMSSNELQHYFERKEVNYSRWENKETKYGIDDVDEDLLLDFVRTANEKGRIDYVYRNAEDTLNRLGLLTDNGKLNNAGWYLFGKNKPLTIKEASYPTDSRVEFGEIKEFRGNIFECIKEAYFYIQNHIEFKSKIEGLQRIEEPEIPLRALREILLNSFAHCNYGIEGDYNQIIIYKSSIRIYNPGPIYQDIDPRRFASGNVGSKIRNLLISSVLYKYGYIDAFGTGFDRTFSLCSQNNLDYHYQNDEFGFTFVFERKINNVVNDIGFTYHTFGKLDDEMLRHIRGNKYITTVELAEKTGKSEPTIARHLLELSKNGVLRRVGSRKTGYWEIL
ncbi:MAG: putative DNA binding domain-containing protein [Erysipelotrichaceae bacterium]|nr:putative DNA binding domain-containing protein [Erysipelotrichaceae bacterium]